MGYKVKYDPESDVLLIVLREEGVLDYAEEEGDIVLHYGRDGRVLVIEVLNASRIVAKLVEALARREAVIPV